MRRVLLALLLLLPAGAYAQTSRFELTPFVGYRLDGSIDSSSDLGFNTDVQVDESSVYGATFDIPLSPSWQLEILANRQSTSFSVDDGLLNPARKLGDVDIDYYQAGFLFQWGRGQVNPFLVATAGIARIDPQFPELDVESYFAATLGGGVKVFVTPNVGFRFEARGYWVNLQTNFDNRYDRYDSEGDLVQGEASAGLILSF
jgi:hypothetical protein